MATIVNGIIVHCSLAVQLFANGMHPLRIACLRVEVDALVYNENGDIVEDIVADDRAGLSR